MKLRAPTYAEVASTLALKLALGAGSAFAANLVTGKNIAKNAVSSKHINDGRIKETDLNVKVRAKLNTRSAAGPVGPRGVSAWDKIPSGITIRGQEYAMLRGSEGVINVSLPPQHRARSRA